MHSNLLLAALPSELALEGLFVRILFNVNGG